MKKGLLGLIFSSVVMVSIVLSVIPAKSAYANDTASLDAILEGPMLLNTGEEPLVEKNLTKEDIQSAESQYNVLSFDMALADIAKEGYWKQFSSKVYYNKLNDKQKEVWDMLEAEFLKLMTTDTNVDGELVTVSIRKIGISHDDAFQVLALFAYANPQYYFVDNSYYLDDFYAALGVYKEFRNGKKRMETTRQFKAQIDAWLSDIDFTISEYDRVNDYKLTPTQKELKTELEIIALVDDELTYKNSTYSQSAYSAFIDKETVCAGYVKAVSMLLAANGIDQAVVSSTYKNTNHAWNIVKLDKKWYVADATWADQVFYIRNAAINTTDAEIASIFKDEGLHNSKNYKDFYTGSDKKSIVPKCEDIIVPAYQARIASPSFYVAKEDTVVTVMVKPRYADATTKYCVYSGNKDLTMPCTVSFTTDAEIKSDGTEYINAVSGIANSKTWENSRTVVMGLASVTYVGTDGKDIDTTYFPVGKTVKLVNSSDVTGWNSEPDGNGFHFDNGEEVKALSLTPGENVKLYAEGSLEESEEEATYTISYKLNGGKNNKKNPAKYSSKTSTITLKEPTKAGYTFKGWFLDKKYTKKITKIKTGTTGKLVLYAKWVPNKYKIVFKGNKSTSGSMKAISGTYSKGKKLTANKFKRKNYTFAGWNTKANGKGKKIKNKADLASLATSTKGKKIVLYAQWKKKK